MYIHINRGIGRKFYAVTRLPGHRKWQSVGPFRKSEKAALADLAKAFKDQKWKRGMVLFISDYYDPVSLIEIKR